MEHHNLEEVCSKITAIVSDIDGVLTNGEIVYSTSGEELKSFNVKDGSSIRRIQAMGIETAFITGRKSKTNRKSAKELDISCTT